MSGPTTTTVSNTLPFIRGDRLNLAGINGPVRSGRIWRADHTTATLCYPWSWRWCWLAIEDCGRWCRTWSRLLIGAQR